MGGDRILLPSILMLMLLVLFALVTWLRETGDVTPRGYRRLLGALILGGLVVYAVPPFGRVAATTGARQIHYYDTYHYYVAAKYFAELGYEGLYEATVAADFEDDRENFRPGVRVRDLRDGVTMTTRARLMKRTRIRSRFSGQRWQEFKRDISFFRARNVKAWHASAIQRDHGYNGTPLTTAVIGFVSGLSSGEPATFLLGVVWVDLILILALACVVARMLGIEVGLTLLFFWLVNPFNGYEYIGGSILRYSYFVALTLGLAFFIRGRTLWSGIAIAFATLFSLFPMLFAVALLGADLVASDRLERLRAHVRFYAAFASVLLVLLAITSSVQTPGGANPWVAFAERISEHENAHAPNSIGLRYPFMYSAEHNTRHVRESAGALDWVAETTRTYEQRRVFYGIVVVVALAGFIVYARRTRREDALFLGLLALFSLILATSYYWCVLALVPLLFWDDRRLLLPLAGTMIVVILTGWNFLEVDDLRFMLYSLEIGLLLLGIAVWRARERTGVEREG